MKLKVESFHKNLSGATMNCFPVYLCLFLFLRVSSLTEAKVAQVQNDGIHIVYMGAAGRRIDYDQLMGSLITRKKNAVVHSYNNGFAGFAARLSAEEARSIAQRPGVVSVFPDPILQLHTTRSWDFLAHQTDIEIDERARSDTSSNEADTIIGILDSGIWPEAKSFNDEDMGPIPSRWNGKCMKGRNFTISNCSRKLIGARYYQNPDSPGALDSPRDEEGHGTHIASIAAGSPVQGASYHGLAEGVAKGGSPGSRIAMYRVCSPDECRGSAILKAFDDAIADGVDVLSLSLGPTFDFEQKFSTDPISIGAFHAVEKGIIVVCAAGNMGPDARSVINTAPWILTVAAATTIDRQFETDVVLGGNKVIKGGGINYGNIDKAPVYPLITGISAREENAFESEARICVSGSLAAHKVKGKIVICEESWADYAQTIIKTQHGAGVILIDDYATRVVSDYGTSPVAVVTKKASKAILSYINSTRNPVATILATKTVERYKPAPTIADFSARGPTLSNPYVLKPDIAAPGVNILAAWPGIDAKNANNRVFNVQSGTSMSCPHVSAVAATVKSKNPTFGPSAIRSAIMTTAIQTNNMKAPITTHVGSPATPYDLGAGEISTTGALQPGLVYETEILEYLQYLCYIGYNITQIKLIASSVPDHFTCPSNSRMDLISNMNYPSIAVSNIKGGGSKKVTRTVTNVGEDNSVYTAIVAAPEGLQVQVTPNKLEFTRNKKKLSFEVTFKLTSSSAGGDLFGSITWTNAKYKVRSPFVVNLMANGNKNY